MLRLTISSFDYSKKDAKVSVRQGLSTYIVDGCLKESFEGLTQLHDFVLALLDEANKPRLLLCRAHRGRHLRLLAHIGLPQLIIFLDDMSLEGGEVPLDLLKVLIPLQIGLVQVIDELHFARVVGETSYLRGRIGTPFS